ncbi:hypothetical protein [Proteus phage P16-2532]|nr:hypothetical protein [Proteus phage P16-2532]
MVAYAGHREVALRIGYYWTRNRKDIVKVEESAELTRFAVWQSVPYIEINPVIINKLNQLSKKGDNIIISPANFKRLFMTKLDEVRKLSYSFKLPEDVREGTYVVLRFESEVGKWYQNVNIVSYMLGVISHTTKTQFQVSCDGLSSPMRFGRDGGIRADSKGQVGGALRTSVFLAGSVDTAEEYIKGQVEQHNDPEVVRREPTFHLKHADDLIGIIVKLDKLISDATTLWGAIPENGKVESNDVAVTTEFLMTC